MSFGSNSYGSSVYGGLNAFNIFTKALPAVLSLSELKYIEPNKKLSEIYTLEELTTAIKNFEKRTTETINITETISLLNSFLMLSSEFFILENLYKGLTKKHIEYLDIAITEEKEINQFLEQTLHLNENISKENARILFDIVNISDSILRHIELKETETLVVTEDINILEYNKNIHSNLILTESDKKQYFAEILDEISLQEFISRSKDKFLDDYFNFSDSIDRKAERSVAPKTTLLTKKR